MNYDDVCSKTKELEIRSAPTLNVIVSMAKVQNAMSKRYFNALIYLNYMHIER